MVNEEITSDASPFQPLWPPLWTSVPNDRLCTLDR